MISILNGVGSNVQCCSVLRQIIRKFVVVILPDVDARIGLHTGTLADVAAVVINSYFFLKQSRRIAVDHHTADGMLLRKISGLNPKDSWVVKMKQGTSTKVMASDILAPLAVEVLTVRRLGIEFVTREILRGSPAGTQYYERKIEETVGLIFEQGKSGQLPIANVLEAAVDSLVIELDAKNQNLEKWLNLSPQGKLNTVMVVLLRLAQHRLLLRSIIDPAIYLDHYTRTNMVNGDWQNVLEQVPMERPRWVIRADLLLFPRNEELKVWIQGVASDKVLQPKIDSTSAQFYSYTFNNTDYSEQPQVQLRQNEPAL